MKNNTFIGYLHEALMINDTLTTLELSKSKYFPLNIFKDSGNFFDNFDVDEPPSTSKWEFNPYREFKNFQFKISNECLKTLLNSEWKNKTLKSLDLSCNII